MPQAYDKYPKPISPGRLRRIMDIMSTREKQNTTFLVGFGDFHTRITNYKLYLLIYLGFFLTFDLNNVT